MILKNRVYCFVYVLFDFVIQHVICYVIYFKIGRKQLGGDLFDLVVSDPAGKDLSQLDSFNAMKVYLGKIQ